MILGMATVSLQLQDAQSLKDKRRVVKSLVERVRKRFNASVAEIGSHDLWQRTELGIAVVGCDRSHVDSQLQHIVSYIEREASALVTSIETEIR